MVSSTKHFTAAMHHLEVVKLNEMIQVGKRLCDMSFFVMFDTTKPQIFFDWITKMLLSTLSSSGLGLKIWTY